MGGAAGATTAPIGNTLDDRLYQAYRIWPASATPGYRFTVPNGRYEVRFKFAEPVATAAGQRRFSVKIEGATVLSNYDIFAAAGGKNTAAPDKVFTVNVSDGQLAIDFVAGVGRPLVSAIQVKQVVTVRVECRGSGRTGTAAGQWWAADRAYTAGSWGYVGAGTGTFTTTQPIAGTTDDSLYQSERNGMSEYRFTVPNGAYTRSPSSSPRTCLPAPVSASSMSRPKARPDSPTSTSLLRQATPASKPWTAPSPSQ